MGCPLNSGKVCKWFKKNIFWLLVEKPLDKTVLYEWAIQYLRQQREYEDQRKEEKLASDFQREGHVLWAKDQIVPIFEIMKGKKYEHLTTPHGEFVVVALSDLNNSLWISTIRMEKSV